jgi:hypothetical protein
MIVMDLHILDPFWGLSTEKFAELDIQGVSKRAL